MMIHNRNVVAAWMLFAFCHSHGSTVASIAMRTMFAAITGDTVAAGTAGNRFAHRKTVIHLLPPRLVSFRSRSFSGSCVFLGSSSTNLSPGLQYNSSMHA